MTARLDAPSSQPKSVEKKRRRLQCSQAAEQIDRQQWLPCKSSASAATPRKSRPKRIGRLVPPNPLLLWCPEVKNKNTPCTTVDTVCDYADPGAAARAGTSAEKQNDLTLEEPRNKIRASRGKHSATSHPVGLQIPERSSRRRTSVDGANGFAIEHATSGTHAQS